jgi:PIN domain nuclease of toxin-antitoxin system
MPLVYDASALLAVIFSEPGSEVVMDHLGEAGGEISAANLAEVGSKMAERGLTPGQVEKELVLFALTVSPVDEAQAILIAALRMPTMALGLSLGDRCCLALAQTRGATVLTADRSWKKLKGFDVKLIR